MKKRLTVADVAQRAGVSAMTVSRAINNKPGVSEEVRKRILDIAAEMDFRPSQVARGLATSQTATIGLVVPDITNPFFAQIARGVEDVAYENSYSVFLINTAENQEREAAALNTLWQQNIDGAILCSLRQPLDKLQGDLQRFPAVVLMNRDLKKPLAHVVSINVNDFRGAQTAVEHLAKSGRKRIGFIAGPQKSISSQKRLEGYRAGLKAAGISYEANMVEYCQPNTECGREAAKALLERHPDLDAIYAFNDLIAFGAIQEMQEVGKSVPQDVAVIGVDNIPLSTVLRPQLSTLSVNQNYIGRLAMRTLLEIMNGETIPATYQIEPELVLRESG